MENKVESKVDWNFLQQCEGLQASQTRLYSKLNAGQEDCSTHMIL
jgi:hypothetical protein